MRTIRPETADRILKDLAATSSGLSTVEHSTGGVYCVNRNVECVPFKLGDRSFLLEFQIPYFLTQVDPYEQILLKTKSGAYFVPKLEHRFLNTSLLDGGALTQLCTAPKGAVALNKDLADAMRNAVIVYYRSYPNANQFFYMFDAETKDLLNRVVTDIPLELKEKYAFEQYTDLAAPYGGFSITSKRL